jgi:glutamine synthetase
LLADYCTCHIKSRTRICEKGSRYSYFWITRNSNLIILLKDKINKLTYLKMKFSTAIIALASASSAMAFAPIAAPQRSTALNGVLPSTTGQSSLDPAVIAKYDALGFPAESILAEYVWVDAIGNTRSKTRTLPPNKVESVDTLPSWNFDGSSTDQAPGDDSEVILKPQRIFSDPFRPRSDGAKNILVMCDTYTPSGEPLETNSRAYGE